MKKQKDRARRRGEVRRTLRTALCCGLIAAALFGMPKFPATAPTAQAPSYDAAVPALSTPEETTAVAPVPSSEPDSRTETTPAESDWTVAAPEASTAAPETQPQNTEPQTQAPVTEPAGGEMPPTEPAGEPVMLAAAEPEGEALFFYVPTRSTPNAAASRTLAIKPGRDYLNSLASAADSIDYEMTVSERGMLHYAVSTEAGEGADWKISLLQQYYVNGSGGETALRLLNVLNVYAEDGKGSAPNIGVLPGKYVLRVESGKKYTNTVFRLRPDFTPGTDYEMEYNDARTRYTEIYAGVPVKGSASVYDTGRDIDWFLLRTYTAGPVNLRFTHATAEQLTTAFKVCLYTMDGVELFGGSAVQNEPELISGRIGLPAGCYFISVQSRVYTAGDYTLTVQSGSAASELEPNDTPAAATPITAETPLRGALSARSGNADRDYYSFTLDAPGYVNVWLRNDESEQGSSYVRRLMLLDGDGRALYGDMQAEGGEALRSPGVGLAAGTYYICVNNDNLHLSSDTYLVGYAFTPSGGWEREYNGAPEFATPISANVPVSGTLTDADGDFDTDYYTFTVTESCAALLQLRHEKLGGNNDIFNVSVLDSALKPVGEAFISYESGETASGTYRLAPGQYYVKVTAGKYSSSVRYYLQYSIEK